MAKKSGLAWVVASLLWTSVTAGTSGKIQGYVRDSDGEPLPGANVTIEGTRRGASTNVEGFYHILLVEPGAYTLRASLIGYASQRQTGVTVQSDFTSSADFVLKDQMLMLEEEVVIARRPPVEPDRTTSKYVVDAGDIEAIPTAKSVAQAIELQAGVSLDGEFSIRAGNPEHTATYIDGVRIPTGDGHAYGGERNELSRGATLQSGFGGSVDVNLSSVQELTVVTGGMDAEYGNAQSGVVSVVTQDGGEEYRGLVNYQFQPAGQKHWGPNAYDSNSYRETMEWDNPEWVAETVTLRDGREALAHRREDYTGKTGHFVEGNLSGPLSRDLTFFVSSRYRREASVLPSASLTTPPNSNSTGKVSYSGIPNGAVRAGGFFYWRKAYHRGAQPGSLRRIGRDIFMEPAPFGGSIDQDGLVWLGITQGLSEKTFYEVKLSHSWSKRDSTELLEGAGEPWPETVVGQRPTRDRSGVFTMMRHGSDWRRYSRERLTLKSDLTSQLNRRNHIKAGFELIRYDNWFQRYLSGNTLRNVIWYGASYGDTDFLPGGQNKGVNPIELGAYLQDKIEFEGMIVNVGLRFQSLWTRTPVKDASAYFSRTSPMYWSLTRAMNAPETAGTRISALSPRLGVSHPITDRSIIRFYYGKSVQMPTFDTLFGNHWISRAVLGDRSRFDGGRGDRDLNENGRLDEAERWGVFDAAATHPFQNLPPEQTINFELGFDWNFYSAYVLGATVYYRSLGDQLVSVSQGWVDPATGRNSNFGSWGTGGWQDTRGIELSFRKRFTNHFSFNLAYNLQWSESGRFGPFTRVAVPDSLFVANGHYWTTYDVDPLTGREIPVSLREQAIREGLDEEALIREYGAAANNSIRGQDALYDEGSDWAWVPWLSHYAAEGVSLPDGSLVAHDYGDDDRAYWERVNGTPGYPGTGEANILVSQRYGSNEAQSLDRDRRNFGSLTLMAATPSDFGPLGGKALGNLRANLVYRMFTGIPIALEEYGFRLDAGDAPMHTRTDLNVEKEIGDPRGTTLTLAMEVYNLFQQKDINGDLGAATTDLDFDPAKYKKYGITGLAPTSGLFQTYGELNDLENWTDRPREIRLGVRLRW